jgi:outer membrane receptor protein involved in Fe transport
VVGRNTFFGDGQATVDLGLYKTFRMPSQHNLTVRFEAFNAFNSVQYGFPTADISNVNFGRVLGGATQYAPRTLQFGLQYKF